MGKKHRRNEFIHKGRVVAQFEVCHHESDSFRLLQKVLGEGEKPCPKQRTIPDKDKLFAIDLREETDEDRLFQIEMTAKAAGNDHLLDILKA